jgi:hypothetical protein
MPNANMLIVNIPSVGRLSVVILSVVAPWESTHFLQGRHFLSLSSPINFKFSKKLISIRDHQLSVSEARGQRRSRLCSFIRIEMEISLVKNQVRLRINFKNARNKLECLSLAGLLGLV